MFYLHGSIHKGDACVYILCDELPITGVGSTLDDALDSLMLCLAAYLENI